jgi:PASTA domain
MALTKPALTNVQPGEPVTAQGWNTLVNGLSDLFDAVLAFGQGVLDVSVLDNSTPVPHARVTAVPATGDLTPIEAVPLYGSVETYTVVGVTAGVWHVFVDADGYQAQNQDVTIPAGGPLVFNLVRGTVVPDLFGVGLQDALAQLTSNNLNVDVILDVLGHEVPKTSVPPQYSNQPILDQLPPAGTIVDPASQLLRLVVSTALDQTPAVTMPSLVGLSIEEVTSVLSGLGLTVGKTTIQS